MSRYSTAFSMRRILVAFFFFAVCGLLVEGAPAQVANRIQANLATGAVVPVKNSLHSLAQPQYDAGRAAADTPMSSMLMVFAPSAAQQSALTALLAAQQNPASPSYHQWLTPATYAAQFGMSSHDLAAAEAWLQQSGLAVLGVSNARNAISFSGSVAQVEAAFHTEMHRYTVDGETHLANATELSLPAGMAGAVAGIHNIAQFRPRPFHIVRKAAGATNSSSLRPNYTDTTTTGTTHYLAPSDIETIYDIKALYNAGFTGANQSIAIMGQSAIATSDLDGFRTSAGLPTKEPTQILVPNTGASTVQSTNGDESESDIDLEWASAIAQQANIYFVYAGATGSVFEALQYAIDNKTAPILSISYGECELQAASDPATFEPIFMQANAQGQTIVASAGDAGATGCDTGTTTTSTGTTVAAAATLGLAVSYPASSAYVTGMGGTQFNAGSTNYFNSTNDQNGGSAISYIPETAWNETSTTDAGASPTGFSSTGGGASVLFGKPSWQVATGVPQDNARDVPDISLSAAINDYGFLYCSANSCSNGLVGVTGTSSFATAIANNSIAGGTSFDAPVFAGILALISQKNNNASFGNINPVLYSLYSTSSPVFHDITAGTNAQPCSPGSVDCPAGTSYIGYTAGVGYDQVTGLGTIDAYNLAGVFPASTTVASGSLTATATTLQTSTANPFTGTPVTFTAGVTASAGTSVPSGGTVQFAVNGANQGSPVSLSSAGTATFSYTFTTAATATVTATYSGTSTDATSSSTLSLAVKAPSTGQFTMAATNVTLASGANAPSTLTITPHNSYAGTVDLTYTTPSNFTGCLTTSNAALPVSGTAPVTATITVDTLGSDCVTTGSRHLLTRVSAQSASTKTGGTKSPFDREEYPIAAAALLAGFALIGRRRKRWPLAAILMLASLGTVCGLSGCGSTNNNGNSITGGSTPGNVPAGTYTITLIGQDSVTSTVTATTTFTATVH